jgi:ferric-dicitrate binding protein FerR (iron transport regulator)
MKLTPEMRAHLEDWRDSCREAAALFREVAETARNELKRRGMTDEQVDADLKKPRRRKRKRTI